MRLSPGRLQAVLAERDQARAERDAATIALAHQVARDRELEQRLESLTVHHQPSVDKQGQPSPSHSYFTEAPSIAGYSEVIIGAEPVGTDADVNDDEEDLLGKDPSDAAWLCASACLRCAESMAHAAKAAARLLQGFYLCCRAIVAVGLTIRRGTHATLGLIATVCTSCRLPTPPPLPPPGEDDEDDPIVDASPGLSTKVFVAGACTSAVLIFVWNWTFGIQGDATWVPLGAISGLAGVGLGIGVAALTTPYEEITMDVDELQSGKMWVDLQGTAWSVGATTAFTATISGIVAWSVHEYPAAARTRALFLANMAMLIGFSGRFGYKTWRGGGCSRTGRVQLVARDGRCGCGWPALL